MSMSKELQWYSVKPLFYWHSTVNVLYFLPTSGIVWKTRVSHFRITAFHRSSYSHVLWPIYWSLLTRRRVCAGRFCLQCFVFHSQKLTKTKEDMIESNFGCDREVIYLHLHFWQTTSQIWHPILDVGGKENPKGIEKLEDKSKNK